MALLPVLQHPDPRLRIKARPVAEVTDQLRAQIDDMIETMHEQQGAGLAATQVGIDARVFIMEHQGDVLTFINPELMAVEGHMISTEGCLSFPGVYVKVKRAAKVIIKALDYQGQPFTMTYEDDGGFEVYCVQHEIDHLNGVTFFDHLSRLKRNLAEKKLAKYRQNAM